MEETRELVPGAKSVISLVRAVGRIDYPEELLEHLGCIYLSRSYLPPDDTLEGSEQVRCFAQIAIEK